MKLTLTSIFLLPLIAAPVASAALIVDFTSTGAESTANGGGFVFSTLDPTGTGVSFTVTASEANPGGGANGATGDITRINVGLGSTVENTGAFLNVISSSSEELVFTISNVTGLQAGQSLGISALLSQNSRSQNTNQSGGFGGTFGHVGADSVTLSSDSGSSFVVNQSDTGDLGSSLLNADNGQADNTGNTFAHDAGDLGFTTSFNLSLTDLSANNAVVIQGFEFSIIPEPSTSFLALGGLSLLLIRKRRA